MSTIEDTYEQALCAVSAALDALCAEKAKAVLAFDPEAEDYNISRHVAASHEHTGVCDALALVTGMLSDYRKASA